MLFKLALRNLFRNRWRSALTAGGVAVATFILIWSLSWMNTFFDVMVRGATAVDTGQIRISTAAETERSSIYNAFPTAAAKLDAVRDVSGVTGASPRVEVFGLVGNEQRSQVAQISGIDPSTEPDVTRVRDGITEGRWLSEVSPERGAREVLLGATLAKLLKVDVGDELVVFLQAADGSLGNDLLKIVGIVETGNTRVDRTTAYMHLEDVQWLASLEGKAHEVLLSVEDLDAADAVADDVQAILGSEPTDPDDSDSVLVAQSWREVAPELAQMIEVSDKSVWIMYLIIYLIAGLGILNTQRMSALERRREFGVLLAIGLTPLRIGVMIVLETVMLTTVGAGVGVAAGLGLVQYHATAGLDMGAFASSGADFDYMGVAFDERIYFVLRADAVFEPVAVILAVAFFCGLWPAISAARIDAVRAIAGRQ